MTARVARAGLQVAAELAAFVEEQALPGTGVEAAAFWGGFADLVADLPVADLEGKNALRRDGVVALFMRDDSGRATKVAALGHVLAQKHRNGAAVLALHLIALVRAPAAA